MVVMDVCVVVGVCVVVLEVLGLGNVGVVVIEGVCCYC